MWERYPLKFQIFCSVIMRTWAVIHAAIRSRLVVIIIQFIGNHLIRDHDAGVFVSPKTDIQNSSFDEIIQETLGGFLRWDAQYFTHIAKYGYTYENTLAFFPLYPILISLFSRLLLFLCPFISLESSILLTSLSLNLLIFVFAAISLYRLSLAILLKEDLAYKSAIFFCYNPSSVFFSAPYSETLFVYLSFTGVFNIIQLYKKYLNVRKKFNCKDLVYLVPIALSTFTRSNGVLNIGFVLYFFVSFYYQKVIRRRSKLTDFLVFTRNTFAALVCSIFFCVTPFLLYQTYAYRLFCRDFNNNFPDNIYTYAVKNYLVLTGTFSQNNQSWCYQKIPFSYFYIQNHYWNVGFLRYFIIKQFPNFLLAFPITFLILKCSYEFFKHYPSTLYQPFFRNEKSDKFLPKSAFVFIIHAMFLTVFNFFCIHVQVSTRILCSASPVLYWYCAHVFKYLPMHEWFKFRTKIKLNILQAFIKFYFVTYFIIGTVLFCNFLPWT